MSIHDEADEFVGALPLTPEQRERLWEIIAEIAQEARDEGM